MIDEKYIAYCAGLFEGEGNIQFVEEKGIKYNKRRIALRINMTDLSPLEMFQDLIERGVIYGPYNTGKGYKSFWTFQVANYADVKYIADLLYAWLSPRRQKQIDEALSKYREWEELYKDRHFKIDTSE